MDPKTIRAALEAKQAEWRRLADPWKGREIEMPKETADQISAVLGQFDELKAKLALASQVAAGDAFLNEPQPTKAAHLGWREAAPDEGNPVVDAQAWRSFKAMTPHGEKEFRYHVPLAVQGKGYLPAFEAYLRKGFGDLGPNDRKTLTEGVDTAGGFLVPEDFQAQLVKKIAATAVIRGMARRIQTSRDIVSLPRINYSTDDIYTSGVRLTWTGESPAASTTHRVTDPVFGVIQTPVHTAMASMPINNNLIEDAAFDVLGLGSDLIGEAFALGEDNVFVNGTGIAQPMGVLGQAEDEGPAAVHLGATDVPTLAGLVNLEAALPAQYERNAVFLARKATYAVIRQAAQTTSGQLLWAPSVPGGYLQPQPASLLGYPVYRSEFVPAIASASYSLILGDWSGYWIVDRVGLSIQRLSELYAETNITLLLARRRVGGYCVEPYRFKLGQMSS